MTSTPRCDLIVPCRDEAPALPSVLTRVPAGFGAIVVDNGSRDSTASVGREFGARIVFEPEPGYGAAVHAGLMAATAEFVGVIDGDGTMDPGELSPMLTIVETGGATMAVGRRRPTGRGVWPWHARAGTALMAWNIRRHCDFDIHDLAPMRVCRRIDLLGLGIKDRRFGYPLELMMKASRAGWTVQEIDIAYGARAAGTTSKVSGSVRGTTAAIADFIKVLR